MFCVVHSMGIEGLKAYPVIVEVDIAPGMVSFELLGLPDAAVKESKNRVQTALKNCGYQFPIQKITVNLAPANVKKTGALYDLPILLGILQAMGQWQGEHLENAVFIGELSLSGQVRGTKGILPMTLKARQMGFKKIFVSKENQNEACVVKGIQVFGVSHVKEITDFYMQNTSPAEANFSPPIIQKSEDDAPDFSEVKGQQVPKRALEIAAAGGHNALMIGPPGSGKSMLAKRLPGILPRLTLEEAIQTSNIYSIAGFLTEKQPLITRRPFRAPHHSISASGLIGGGVPPRPGEASLAHNGVLFLDELPEFHRDAKEALRQPIEDHIVRIHRAGVSAVYPCKVTVIAAMNPCPCGYYGHPTKECSCTPAKIHQYLNRVSGPLLDRLDLHIEVAPVDFKELSSAEKAESSSAIRQRVLAAREVQKQRFHGRHIFCNAYMATKDLEHFCSMTDRAKTVLKAAFEKLGFSARAYERLLKISRTIADLDRKEVIDVMHISEAIQYRTLDRKYWIL